MKAADPRDSSRTPGARGVAHPAPQPPGGRPRRRIRRTSLPLLAESPPLCEVLLVPRQASASLPQMAQRASPACGLQGAHSGSSHPLPRQVHTAAPHTVGGVTAPDQSQRSHTPHLYTAAHSGLLFATLRSPPWWGAAGGGPVGEEGGNHRNLGHGSQRPSVVLPPGPAAATAGPHPDPHPEACIA